jgi:AraC family transcriptional activator of pyochelin receptor
MGNGKKSAWDCLNFWDMMFPASGEHKVLPSSAEVFFCDFTITEPLQVEYLYEQSPIVFTFWLSGIGRGHFSSSKHENESIELGPGKTGIHYSPGVRGRTEMPENQHYRSFSVYVSPSWLHRLLEEEKDLTPPDLRAVLEGTAREPYLLISDMSARVRMILDQIYACPHKGAYEKMFLENKCMDLILCRLEEHSKAGARTNHIRMSSRDIERIHEAKHIITDNLENPPTLRELGRMVGVNTTKLSYGFRELYGATAHAVLQKERLRRAGDLLAENRMNITEISQYLGFSDASHFVREFSKQYGTTPGKFAKSSEFIRT